MNPKKLKYPPPILALLGKWNQSTIEVYPMINVNFVTSLRAFFNFFSTFFLAMERNAKSFDNISKLGEQWTEHQVNEQDILNKKRLEDIQAKVDKKYETEKKQWNL